MSENTYIYR